MEHTYALIMAGGGGTRLWPMSRNETPKQLLPLIEEQSMFQVSVERLSPLLPPERIYVVTGAKYVDALRAQTPEVPHENFITEPYGRDSGPAAALGISVIQKRDPKAVIALLTADHHISDRQGFRNVLAAGFEAAEKGFIITLGISATLPSTAFGYIRRGEQIDTINGWKIYRSLGFTEKPNVERAVAFIRSGEYGWNSGMFIWTANRAMAEFELQQPAMYAAMQRIATAVDTPAYDAVLAETWELMPKISLDYAVMEHAEGIAVIPVDIGWSDVGSWDALFDVLNLDEDGNGFKGAGPDHVTLDTRNTLVYSDKLTVTIGLEDLVIVDTSDVLLVCHRDRAQDVKQIVNMLKDRDGGAYL
ncbi:MAG: Mannose-1-phosphate guanylyltransferase (GDP) [Chloroflexi bacterium OLB15]|nr:MAG: Mannose-1-phosphate guanylyltransferase (GDP) [Chloroflexi bacterium OLB15]